jgi:SOS response regulatory protein OraA/RecX
VYILKDVTPAGGGDRVILKLEGESEQALVTVSPEMLSKLKLKKGERVSREAYAELSESAELDGAMRKGLAILGYGTNSVARLEGKLMRHGYSAEIAAKAASALVERGYIDEEKDALRLCDSMILKKYGPRKILVSLRNRGYNRQVLQKAEEFLREIDFSEVCRSLIASKFKKIPENREETKKIIAKLTTLGYNVGDIRRALEDLG